MALIKVIDSMTSGLSLAGHSHVIADVATLQTALDGKATSAHTHLKTAITDYNVAKNLAATGVLAETIPREVCLEASVTYGASGSVFQQAIYLMSGTVINNIVIWSSITAGATLTSSAAAIYSGVNLVALSDANLTATWPANTQRAFVISGGGYTVPSHGVYYIGLHIAGTTMPTIKGNAARLGGQIGAINPTLASRSTSAGYAAPPAVLSTVTNSVDSIYAAVL